MLELTHAELTPALFNIRCMAGKGARPTIGAHPCFGLDGSGHHAHDLVGNLGHWLVARDPEIVRWSEPLGRSRFERSIPLHELIRCLLIIKARLIDFAREELLGTALQIYAEEELEYRVGRFFDEVIYHVAKGFESALHEAISDHGGEAKPAHSLKFHATPNAR